MRRPVTAAAAVAAGATNHQPSDSEHPSGSGKSKKRSSKKRKKPVPSASYYDPAFTWPQLPGAAPMYTPGGGGGTGVEEVDSGPKTATTTTAGQVTSKSGDIVYPKIDINSIFF